MQKGRSPGGDRPFSYGVQQFELLNNNLLSCDICITALYGYNVNS